MEAEHRELGLGDPGLGRKVRKLVSSLGRRVELWRAAVAGGDFSDAARQSLGDDEATDGATAHNMHSTEDLVVAPAGASRRRARARPIGMSDDFAHRLKIDQIRDGDRIDLVASEAERTAIAERLRLESLDRLDAHAVLARKGAASKRTAALHASLEQSCVVTGEPVPAHVDEPFDIVFTPEPEQARSDEEVELGSADCDVVFHDGSTIDLGAAIADTLALALDPYPRSAGAEAALKEAGVLSEEQAGPFAALGGAKEGKREVLLASEAWESERNVVVEVAVERGRLRTRLRP